jgi:hypothetical protein
MVKEITYIFISVFNETDPIALFKILMLFAVFGSMFQKQQTGFLPDVMIISILPVG